MRRAAVHVHPASHSSRKALKVHFKLLDRPLRPETRQRLLLVNEKLHHCFHYLHNLVRSWICADTLVEVYRHELRAYENRLTFWLTTMITFVKEICCSIGQYASRRHLHSTGLRLSCSHIVHLDHRNFCTHTHANLPLTKVPLRVKTLHHNGETQAQARIMYGSSKTHLPESLDLCRACASWASFLSTAHGKHAWTHTIVLHAPLTCRGASPRLHMHGQSTLCTQSLCHLPRDMVHTSPYQLVAPTWCIYYCCAAINCRKCSLLRWHQVWECTER